MNNKFIRCRGKGLNRRIAREIIYEIFAGEEVPTYIGSIANQTIEYHQNHGGALLNEKAKLEVIIRGALNDLKSFELAEKFAGDHWIILKNRRMMDGSTRRKLQNECLNPLYDCLNAINKAKDAIEKNIPLIENEIDVYEVRAQVLGLLDRREIELMYERRPSLKFEFSDFIDATEKLMDDLEILFAMWGHYATFVPTPDTP